MDESHGPMTGHEHYSQPAAQAQAGGRRPFLGAVELPANFQAAIQAGTRTATGAPGPNYWTNFATYKLNARIATDSKQLDGSVEITYHNNSPDTLTNLHLDLTQNFHQAEAIRSEPAEITGGYELRRIVIDNAELREASAISSGPRYQRM